MGLQKSKNCTKGTPEAENKDYVMVNLRSLSKLQLMAELGYKQKKKYTSI